VKVVRAVLRGLGGSNLVRLPDVRAGNYSGLPDHNLPDALEDGFDIDRILVT
jgi:hypothetical protein